MRFVATMFLWLVTTVALAVAVPAAWAQKNIVDENGYSALANLRPKNRNCSRRWPTSSARS